MKVIVAIAAICFSIGAHATLINTSVGDFEITTVEITGSAGLTDFESQPWWDDEMLALEFAQAVAGEFINSFDTGGPAVGAFFAFTEFFAFGLPSTGFAVYNIDTETVGVSSIPTDLTATFAAANPVVSVITEPGSYLPLLLILGVIAWVRLKPHL